MIAAVVLVLIWGLAFYEIAGSVFGIRKTMIVTTEKLQSIMLLNNIITSPECLGTGFAGRLSSTKLDEVNNMEWECTQFPSFSYYVIVTDNREGKKWSFGIKPYNYEDYPDFKRYRKKYENYISIQYPRECVNEICRKKVNPGSIIFYYSYQKWDPILLAATQAELAWIKGEAEKRFAPERDVTLKFAQDKICAGDVCKKLYSARVEEKEVEIFEDDVCTLKYKKENDILKVDLKCIPIVGA
jgi:hypothetical protein